MKPGFWIEDSEFNNSRHTSSQHLCCLVQSRIPNPESRAPASAGAVVRRFLRDLHVMHVALALAGTGDLHELRPRAHVLDGGAADVAHGRAQAAGELVHHAAPRAALRRVTFAAFGHGTVGVSAVLSVVLLVPLYHSDRYRIMSGNRLTDR